MIHKRERERNQLRECECVCEREMDAWDKCMHFKHHWTTHFFSVVFAPPTPLTHTVWTWREARTSSLPTSTTTIVRVSSFGRQFGFLCVCFMLSCPHARDLSLSLYLFHSLPHSLSLFLSLSIYIYTGNTVDETVLFQVFSALPDVYLRTWPKLSFEEKTKFRNMMIEYLLNIPPQFRFCFLSQTIVSLSHTTHNHIHLD